MFIIKRNLRKRFVRSHFHRLNFVLQHNCKFPVKIKSDTLTSQFLRVEVLEIKFQEYEDLDIFLLKTWQLF